ncbi:MAG: hypothetical protein FH758_09530 [Firmicutes bacterium]|nr:hypothetical protein [Bacillota bacterium]
MSSCKHKGPKDPSDNQGTKKVSLGSVIGLLMSEVIKARRIADEQTAALAEYYKENPLLEGLSVPRIRVPELTMDIPMLIEDYLMGESGCLADIKTIIGKSKKQLKSSFNKLNIEVDQSLYLHFEKKMYRQLKVLRKSDLPVMEESVARIAQDALAYALDRIEITLEPTHRNAIMKALRRKVSAVCIVRKQGPDSVLVNIITADVKGKASKDNMARLKITLGEEGLAWSVRSGESGGLEYTLEPE